MSHSTEDRLVYMANQIGTFFASQGADQTVSGVSAHIAKFWDPRMRKQIYAYIERGGSGLDPQVKQAIELLAQKDKSASVSS